MVVVPKGYREHSDEMAGRIAVCEQLHAMEMARVSATELRAGVME